MSIVRAMAVFQGASGLSEDQFVNTFHFTGEGTYEEDALLAAQAVQLFYIGTAEPTVYTEAGSFLSPWILRPFTVKTYDMTAPKVRVPTSHSYTLLTPIAQQGPPEEVAVCLTLHGSTPPASARRRGRIYFGPLNLFAVKPSDVAHRSAVGDDMRTALCGAAKALAGTPLITWCIRSTRPTENYVPIVGGYVDDAFDTQRRRGPDPTDRQQWLAPV